MREIINYNLIRGTKKDIVKNVQNAIDSGWLPIGSLVVGEDSDELIQAVVQYEESEKESRVLYEFVRFMKWRISYMEVVIKNEPHDEIKCRTLKHTINCLREIIAYVGYKDTETC